MSARLEYPAGHDSFWFELIDWALVERQGIASTTRSKMVLGLGWVAIPSMCRVIQFGASPAGDRVLAALRDLQRLWGGGPNKVGVEEIDQDLLIGRGGDWCYRHRMCSRAVQRRWPPGDGQERADVLVDGDLRDRGLGQGSWPRAAGRTARHELRGR